MRTPPPHDYALLVAPDAPLPSSVFRTVPLLDVTETMGVDPYLHYAGKATTVYDFDAYHWVSWNSLFPLMRDNGLLPAAPPSRCTMITVAVVCDAHVALPARETR